MAATPSVIVVDVSSSTGEFVVGELPPGWWQRHGLLTPRKMWAELSWAEASGALGDLGTLIPLVVSMAKAGCVRFSPVIFWGGVMNVIVRCCC